MPAEWLEVRLQLPREEIARATQIAMELGAQGVAESTAQGEEDSIRQPWDTRDPEQASTVDLRFWLPTESEEEARQRLEVLSLPSPPILEVVTEDWHRAWQQHHSRVVIGPDLAISPPWLAQEGDLVIPPGNAFGSGEHPSTRACLEAILEHSAGLETALDFGCGSGVLALAAAQLGLRAEGVDIDADAVASARDNAERNGLTATFSTTAIQQVEGPFDLVAANLYAEVLCEHATELLRLTGRFLVLAGVLSDRSTPLEALLTPPLTLIQKREDGDWVSLVLERQ